MAAFLVLQAVCLYLPHMRKRILNIFLLLVFAIQLLPLQQIGRMLYSNQLTEEMPDAVDYNLGKEVGKRILNFNEYLQPHMELIQHPMIDRGQVHCITHDDIPNNYAADIHVPPPNTTLVY
jgi:hypothetical protein